MGNSNSTEQDVDRTDKSISTTNHLISIQELKFTDHIYRQCNTMWSQRHGIVTYIPLEEEHRTPDQIRVTTIIIHNDYNDIEEISLSKFLAGRKLRRVKYHVSPWYESLHVEGCCHRQIKSKPQTIIERCKAIKEEFEIINNDWSNDSLYLQQITDDHFSFWCSTGITHILITKKRIGTILEEIEDKRLGIYDHNTSIVEVQLNDHDEKNGAELASAIAAKVTTDFGKAAATEVATEVAKKVAKKAANKISTKILAKAAEKAVKLGTEIQETTLTKFVSKVANLTESASAASTTAKEVATEGAKTGVSSVAVAGLVGVSVGLELAATGYRIYKYRNDVEVLWVDTKLTLIQGWTTTGCTVATGLVCLVTGVAAWPAALITCGVGLVCWIGFKIYKYYNGKSSKEKLFKERGLKLNASIREKQAEIRLINKEINEERLHPDKFRFDLPQKYVKIYELKRYPLDITIKVGETGTYAVIDNVKMSQWSKGVRSGMVVYSINNCVVYNNHTFDVNEIKEMFDENISDSSDTIQIGLFKMKKVVKEIERRTKKYHWLEDLKELIKEDIHECRANKRGIKKSRKRNKKQSAPLAITWNQ